MPNTKEVTLLPCPYCGCDSVSFTLDHNQGMKWGYAECDSCGASGPEVRTNYKNEGHQDWHDSALKEWNTRHIPEGYALVPLEPSEEMKKAAWDEHYCNDEGALTVYKAMIQAAKEE